MWFAQIALFGRRGGSPVEGRLAARNGGSGRSAGVEVLSPAVIVSTGTVILSGG